jgi:hypothetical protein
VAIMAQDCEYLEECSRAVFSQLLSENAKEFWIRTCCKSPKQDNCARRALKKAGEPVPTTLLPNGKYVDILDTIVM